MVAKAGALRFSKHSLERGDERSASIEDVYCAVLSADVAVLSKDAPNRWILAGGCDTTGCGLRVVVAIDEYEIVTVTVVSLWS